MADNITYIIDGDLQSSNLLRLFIYPNYISCCIFSCQNIYIVMFLLTKCIIATENLS